MLRMKNTLRHYGLEDFRDFWDEMMETTRRNVTHERIARNGLAFAGALSIGYLAARIAQGVQGLVVYAY